ncbi:DUF433 domain-containing protein [Nodosilinea sp. AN01ver1]|uniref:DUF433 domain-containing protein n=1 Tax=Nodosilinea sp. AN01ver1 TaxID=3423362 RepID=UPI003D30EFEF
MATYPVNLPLQLQQEALQWATDQGIALDDFILWAVAEKIAELKHQFSDRTFPNVAYHQGASGQQVPVVAGTNIRVQTIAIAAHQWGLTTEQLAEEYNLSAAQIDDALAFYAANQAEMDGAIALEAAIEASHV